MSQEFANELLTPLLERFVADANELRWRVTDMPNAATENEAGECAHSAVFGCSWRCSQRTGIGRYMTKEEIRAEILRFIGPALFAVLDGYGEDVTRIESVTLLIARCE
jgi:hypothetical protein